MCSQGLLGLLIGDGNLGGVWNVNTNMDLVRILLGVALIIGSMMAESVLRLILISFGSFYIAMFLVGIYSPSLLGFAPDYVGFSGQVMRIFLGIIALVLGFRLHKKHKRIN